LGRCVYYSSPRRHATGFFTRHSSATFFTALRRGRVRAMKTRGWSRALAAVVAAGLMAVGGCCPREPGVGARSPKAVELPPPPRPALDQVPRVEVNRFAAELHLPLFWHRDGDEDGAIDPDELVVLWHGVEPTRRADWVDDSGFTERFYQAYEA